MGQSSQAYACDYTLNDGLVIFHQCNFQTQLKLALHSNLSSWDIRCTAHIMYMCLENNAHALQYYDMVTS